MFTGSTLETRDLRLVLAIVEAGGATRAGRVLCLSQSAVSHQLRALELRLGLPVFDRLGHKLKPTGAGEKLLKLAREVLHPMMAVERELRRSSTDERVALRLSTQCYSAYHWLPGALAELGSKYPEVLLTLTSEPTSDIGSALAEGRLELGLCVFPPAGRGFERIKLFDDELVLAVPHSHPLAKKRYAASAELLRETLIMSPVASEEAQRVQRALFGEQPRPQRTLRVSASEASIELVRAGMGVTILPNFVLAPYVARGELCAVRLTRSGLHRTWTGVLRRGSNLREPILALLGAVKVERRTDRG